MEDMSIHKINEKDSEEIGILAKKHGGSQYLNKKNISHWYFNNPHNSYSLWKVVHNDKIEGYATTNNFYHKIDDTKHLVAFPQNVLTSPAIRGKGMFKKLYYKTEIQNYQENEVDFFLTFTNHFSSPIFEKKFGYLQGIAPKLLVKLSTPIAYLLKRKYEVVNKVSEVNFKNEIFQFHNGREKDLEYYKWRYSNCDENNLIIIRIHNDNETIGYAFLIKRRVKRIPLLLLTDIISKDENSISKIIDASYTYASRRLYPALIMFELSYNCRSSGINLSFDLSSTFQVKGKTDEETIQLSRTKFNFFYGDLDYFW